MGSGYSLPVVGAFGLSVRATGRVDDRQAEVGRLFEEEFGDRLWFVLRMLPEKPGGLTPCGYNLIVQNPAEAKQILHRVKGLPGVAEVRMDLFEEINVVSETFEEEAARGVGFAPA